MTDGINNPGRRLPFAWGAPTTGVDAQSLGTSSAPGLSSNHFFRNTRSDAGPHGVGQNTFGRMTTAVNPYVSSADHLLATALKNEFSMLGPFKKDGKLTQRSLQQIASEEPNQSDVAERTILLAREILNRPRLNEAIIANGGFITLDSLSRAADSMVGNTHPNTQSVDPYHSKTDAEVVKAFRGMFDELRDTSEDYSFFFEKHRYVKTDKLIEMSKDPDETDKTGEVVRDAATGFPRKKYSEQQVYLARNLVERPGLLASLESRKANGTSLFGSHNSEGWLKNYSIDRWLENDRKEKGN
ncbi:hypothetical protein EXW72_23525 [Pseudomonas sp. BCA14]|uniref:hypothetical protein n=1 Tax=unclassified Pseudomonas TaxID=196821 RepID=UPI00106EA455|nr:MULTISPECIES: hypothetical protein [unclassified Pseudomonas]TFF01726.1 hypothetical protein EXW70_28470 [Pseudomonas sp. JMN1]TFF03654.1 hypothetical protein EXW71_28440 [Pseudomonas sp. BCA17]TFF18613.1 hypothetical protein EXW73_26040 [Pseudomonas sp. BCA13]TFF20013.1 hypothetical protein EXW72_23525 [Pseudomonas sp. BCA14]